ncbi:MAG: PDZ domain-containing protein [Planctomycetaceae bacterium]|nr:PDZ domain-containing protein [Planctomycetaceae bacterium]
MNRKFLWIASICFACICQVPHALALAQDPSSAPVSTEPTATEPTATVPAAQEPVAAKADEPKTDQTEKRLKSIEKLLEAMSGELKARKDAESARKTEEMKKADEKKSEALPDVVTTPRPRPERQSPPRLPPSVKLEPSWLDEIKWRSIGPANMSGRITDIAVHEKDSSLWWIATASGGLLKSNNHGGSFQHQFDREKVVSIGSIATDPNNQDVLWVGTGEINPRNSVSYGNGVYKTTDGGKTFQHLGLDRSYQIARILVDPKNSDTVYVGAAGRLYGTNPERGVYKTTDGGKTWQQILFVDDQTGVIDMAMSPTDPNTIVVAMWDRLRDGFDSWPGSVPKPDGVDGYDPIRKWGKGGGIYRTTDGGANWKKISQGLPPGMTGRIGLDWQQHSPNALYAIIDCEDIGKGPTGFTCYLGLVGQNIDSKAMITQVMGDSPASKAGIQVGDQLISVEGTNVTEFDQLLEALRKKKAGQRISVVLKRGQEDKSYDILLTGRPGTPAQQTTVSLGLQGEDKEDKILVQRVSVGGSASKAGVKIGDLITKVDGQAPGPFQALSEKIQKKAEGDKVQLEIQRGEEKLELTVVLEARVGRGGGLQTPAQSNVYMGIQGEDASGGGATLTAITEAGPAEKSGLKSGDVVIQMDGKDVANYEALVSEIRNRKADDKVKVKVKRGDQNVEVEVTLADRLSGGSAARPYTYSYFGQSPNVQDQQGSDGYKYGGVYKSTDGGETWQRINSLNTRPMYFSVVKVDPSDEKNLFVLGVAQHQSKDGGSIFTEDFGRRVHADGHDLWIDPKDGRHMIIGCDGGIYVTHDRGVTWDHINTAAIGQFYHVAISPKQPYWVAGGLQDNGSWAGPAISRSGGAVNEDWVNLNGGDGFVCRVDPNDPDLFYAESQNGVIVRRNLRTGERGSIRPARVDGLSYRFNWNTPFILSSHNTKIFYTAGNYVFRSLDRGNELRPISPEITLTQRGSATALSESPRDPNLLYVGTDDGALWVTRDGGTTWKNITANLKLPGPRYVATIEASRHYKGRVYVCLDGHRSDDDNPYVFVSEDFGDTFNPLHAGLPWGSTRCMREDLVNPNLLYLGTEFAFWVSVDRGQNWTQFNQNLPTVAIHEVAIHPDNGEIVVATHGRSLWACDVSGLRQLKPENVGKEIAFFDPVDVTRWRSDPGRGGTNRSFAGQNPSSGAKLWYALPNKAEKVVARIENIDGELINEVPAKAEPGLHVISWDLTQTNRDQGGGLGGGEGAGRGERAGRPTDDSGERPGRQRRARGDNPSEGSNAPSDESAPANPNPAANPNPPAQEESDAEGQQPSTPSEGSQNPSAQRPQGQRGPGAGGAPGARAPQGFQGFRGPRPVPNGVYRVQLLVDGKLIKTQSITVSRDPNLPENAVADELYELKILLDKQAKENKYQNKSNGRGNYGDD